MAEDAQTDAESARDLAEGYRDDALIYKGQADTHAQEAAASAAEAANTATVYTTEVYTGVQEALVTMASNLISTQAIVAEHHAFS